MRFKKRDFMFCHFGNGLVVCDRLHEKHGDYERVAFIDANRNVKIEARMSPADIAIIEKHAKEADPNVSATQEGKVFRSRP